MDLHHNLDDKSYLQELFRLGTNVDKVYDTQLTGTVYVGTNHA